MKKFFILFAILSLTLTSCHTTKTYKDYSHSRTDSVTVERIDTVYKEIVKIDSVAVDRYVYEKDSVSHSEKTVNDTVYVRDVIFKYKYIDTAQRESSRFDSCYKWSSLERDLEILRDSTVDVEQIEVDRNAVRNRIATGLLKLMLPFLLVFVFYLLFRKRW